MGKNIKEIKFQAEGITCTACAIDMENILLDKKGVLDVSVSYMEGLINICYAPDEIDRRDIIYNLRKLGLKIKPLSG
ncbi:MAG TPA: cation transporter [Nitrospirae bacterium]|nr:heavy-metal-associated domain protein [bacterium BMS3Abin10]GBE38837.1 heavy-metal-associated domain protein [bacterium BMS3Bbin08]HDH00647.1 cation transporter [Nitrospirota bacterium]HDH50500.1 cation transporter [Nitrospirota bacterium]HDK81335.1 cation transporter [Nitrospirota bacterium]